jgi:hypothetical protein
MINDNNRDNFIDLHCLASSAFYEDQKVVLFFQDEDANDPTLIHLMRKAIRKIRFKIQRIERKFDGDTLTQIEFHTDIPEDVWTESIRLYNDWVEDIGLDC